MGSQALQCVNENNSCQRRKKTKKFTMHIEQPGFIVTIIQKINSIHLLANYESNTNDLIKYRILAAYPALSLCFYFLVYFL